MDRSVKLKIEIRNMENKDKKDFYLLIEKVNREDDLGYSITEEWLDHIIENFSEGIFLLYGENELLGVGTCMINSVYSNQATFNIIVCPEYRSLGLGRELYVCLEKFAKSRGVSLVETFVKERLVESLNFGEKLGFQVNMYSWTMEIDLRDNKIELDEKEELTLKEIGLNDRSKYKSIILHGFGDELGEDSLAEMLKDPSISVYLLEKDLELIGSLTVQKREDINTAYIYDIVVLSHERKKGFGSYMIKSSLEILKEQGIETVSLLVTDENENALNLYREIGFKGTDIDLIMVKNI